MSQVKLTAVQKDVLKDIGEGNLIQGRRHKTLKVLEKYGMIKNIKVHPKFDPVRGYALEFYSAEIVE